MDAPSETPREDKQIASGIAQLATLKTRFGLRVIPWASLPGQLTEIDLPDGILPSAPCVSIDGEPDVEGLYARHLMLDWPLGGLSCEDVAWSVTVEPAGFGPCMISVRDRDWERSGVHVLIAGDAALGPLLLYLALQMLTDVHALQRFYFMGWALDSDGAAIDHVFWGGSAGMRDYLAVAFGAPEAGAGIVRQLGRQALLDAFGVALLGVDMHLAAESATPDAAGLRAFCSGLGGALRIAMVSPHSGDGELDRLARDLGIGEPGKPSPPPPSPAPTPVQIPAPSSAPPPAQPAAVEAPEAPEGGATFYEDVDPNARWPDAQPWELQPSTDRIQATYPRGADGRVRAYCGREQLSLTELGARGYGGYGNRFKCLRSGIGRARNPGPGASN